jgi:hypothetical protein
MPPSGTQPQRNPVRANDKSLPSGPREGSNLQQGGGGTNNLPTAGAQGFGSNVAPAGSQGQQYRGQGQPRQEGEVGRATPPPAQIAELPDEEAAAYLQLQKEYKELRRFPRKAAIWGNYLYETQATSTKR